MDISAPPSSQAQALNQSVSSELSIGESFSTTVNNTTSDSYIHSTGVPSFPDPPSSVPNTELYAIDAPFFKPSSQGRTIGTPFFPDTTPGEMSPAGGETVPTPDPHDTRDPTVSPVQPRSRGMGSLRAVVGALGAGRRSTSVVAAAVVRHGMPRPGRAGAWGTGRVALLVLGVVCGVALLLAAVVLLVLVRRCSLSVQANNMRSEKCVSRGPSSYLDHVFNLKYDASMHSAVCPSDLRVECEAYGKPWSGVAAKEVSWSY